jgi:hypothetical protein
VTVPSKASRVSFPFEKTTFAKKRTFRKRPHKGGAAPKSGAAVAARLLRRNQPTARPRRFLPGRRAGTGQEPGRNRAGTGQEPGRNRAGTGQEPAAGQEPGRNRAGAGQEPGRNRPPGRNRAGTGQEPGRSRAATARPHHSDTEPENARICRHFNIFARCLQR